MAIRIIIDMDSQHILGRLGEANSVTDKLFKDLATFLSTRKYLDFDKEDKLYVEHTTTHIQIRERG